MNTKKNISVSPSHTHIHTYTHIYTNTDTHVLHIETCTQLTLIQFNSTKNGNLNRKMHAKLCTKTRSQKKQTHANTSKILKDSITNTRAHTHTHTF